MGSDSTAELLFKINADAGDAAGNLQRFRGLLSKDLGGIAAEFQGWSNKVFGDLTTLGGATKAGIAAAAAAAVAAGAAFWTAAEKTARFAGEIEDAQDKTGIGAEDLSKLRFAAERTGLAWDSLVGMLVKYETNVRKAADGDAQALASFTRLGIKQEEVKRGTQDLLPLLLKTSDAYKGLSSTVDKVAIGREQFGKNFAEAIEFMSLGSETIRQFGERAAHLGRVLTEEDVVAAKAFELANKELRAEMDGLWFKIGTVGLPILQKLSVFMIAVAETMKKDTGGPIAEIKAWIGFFDELKKASAEIQTALDAATASAGSGRLAPPDAGKVKESATAFEGLSNLLGQVRGEMAGLAGGMEGIDQKAARLWQELEKNAEALGKLQAEGKVAPDTVKREMAALQELAAAIPQLQEQMAARWRREAGEKQVSAERELQDRLAGLQEDTAARREAGWLVEVDALRAKYQAEGALSERAWELLLDIEQAGLVRIREQRSAAFVEELQQTQQWLAGIVTQRMTSAEQLAFAYQADLARWSEAEETKALKTASSEAEIAAVQAMYAMGREALLQRYGQELMVLYNSQGWQGVFGEPFAQALRENEDLLREWAESADQAMMMVRISAEVVDSTLRRGFKNFAAGMGQNIAQAIVYKKSIGEAMREAAASTLAAIAAESFMYAIYSAGLGFVRLAQHDYAAAGEAFTAAAIFGGVGAAAAVAGRMIAPAQGKGEKAAEGAGAGVGAESGTGSSGGTETRGTRVQIIVNGPIVGASGIEEFLEIVNDAVENRDARLVATTARRSSRGTQ